MKRSLIKALTYRLLGTAITAAIALVVTHKWQVAGLIGGVDFVVKIVGYFVHEEVWRRAVDTERGFMKFLDWLWPRRSKRRVSAPENIETVPVSPASPSADVPWHRQAVFNKVSNAYPGIHLGIQDAFSWLNAYPGIHLGIQDAFWGQAWLMVSQFNVPIDKEWARTDDLGCIIRVKAQAARRLEDLTPGVGPRFVDGYLITVTDYAYYPHPHTVREVTTSYAQFEINCRVPHLYEALNGQEIGFALTYGNNIFPLPVTRVWKKEFEGITL